MLWLFGFSRTRGCLSALMNVQDKVWGPNSDIIRVLLVDDNPDDVRLIKAMLTDTKGVTFDFKSAGRFSQGLECLAEGGIDVLLLDLVLPDSYGLDTFVRMHAQAPGVPIIVLTGTEDEELADSAMRDGARDYLIKGQLNTDLLSRAIRYAIEGTRADKALQRSQRQLQQAQKMELLGTLVAGVAHEINNPLNLIMFNVPLLQKIWQDVGPILERHAAKEPNGKYGGLTYDFIRENLGQLLSDMRMATNRAARIVGGLTDFARQSSVTEKSPVQVNTAVGNALRLAGTTLRKAGVKMNVDLRDDLPLIEGNLQSIEQVVLNIIINAIQAIDHDHGEVNVVTGFQNRDGLVFISVSDNGRGINPSISDKIFDPFVTDRQTEGGTGLGLSITYNLVEAHGGEISFKSQVERGTTFQVSFPSALTKKAAKILVVDDDNAIRETLVQGLAVEGRYLVDEAANGIEACIKLGTYRPDLLVLDIVMPHMDGLEVCRTIKRQPELSGMKVIITTGFADHPMLKEIVGLGFSNIYHKPFKLRDFIKAVNECLASG